LGGHRSIVIPFLERMRFWYKKVPVRQRFMMCDMFVYARVIMEEFNSQIITGYPWHSKFKQITDAGSEAVIYHKSIPWPQAKNDQWWASPPRNVHRTGKGGGSLR